MKNHIKIFWLLLLLTICLSHSVGSVCFAGIEDRPLDTDDAYVLAKGTYYFSTGVLFNKIDSSNKEFLVKNTFGAGLADNLEISAFVPIIFTDPNGADKAEGLGDIVLRPEIMFLGERENTPAMSLAFWMNLRTGEESKGLGSEESDYTVTLQMSKKLSAFTLHLNFGYVFVGEPSGQDLDNVISYNTAFEYEVAEKVILVGELFGKTNSDPQATDDFLDCFFGVMYKVSPRIALDLGVVTGLSGASSDYKVTGGAALIF